MPTPDQAPTDDILIEVEGEIDLDNAWTIEERVCEALAKAPATVTIALAGVTFMGSTGVNALLQSRAAAVDADVELRLRDLPPQIRRVLAIAGVEDTFTILERLTGSAAPGTGRSTRRCGPAPRTRSCG